MTSSPYALYILGYTRVTINKTIRSYFVKRSKSIKLILSSDYRLQLVYMKMESLVIVGQLYNGEYVPGFCTHRPSHHGNWFYFKVLYLYNKENLSKILLVTKVKS